MPANRPQGTEQDLQRDLEAEVQENIGTEPRTFEDPYADDLDRLREQARQFEDGRLPTLDDETAAQLDAIRESQLGELDMRRQQERDDLLTALYGRGIQRSSTAGDVAGRMLFGQEQTHRQILSDDAQRRISQRADMADRIMGSLAFQAQVAQQQQQTALQAFGIEVEQEQRSQDRAANMLDSLYGRRSQERIVDSQNATARMIERMRGDTSLRIAGMQAGIERDRLRLDARNSRRQFRLQRMGLREDRRQFNEDLGFRNRHLDLQDTWNLRDISMRRDELRAQQSMHSANMRQQRRSQYLQFFGSLLSDENYKKDVVEIDQALDVLDSLHGYRFVWKDGVPDAGVLAQEVEKVLPESVTDVSGVKMVQYAGLVAVLIQAVRELSDKVKKLEAADGAH